MCITARVSCSAIYRTQAARVSAPIGVGGGSLCSKQDSGSKLLPPPTPPASVKVWKPSHLSNRVRCTPPPGIPGYCAGPRRLSVRFHAGRRIISLSSPRSLDIALLFLLLIAASPAPALDDGIESLRQTGKAFASVARSVSPSVAFVQIEQSEPQSAITRFSPPFGNVHAIWPSRSISTPGKAFTWRRSARTLRPRRPAYARVT
jgi:hypothetical protein